MNRIRYLFLIIFIWIPGRMLCQETNISFGLTITGGSKPRYSQNIRFVNSSKEILPEIIKFFGSNYTKNGDTYEWQKAKVPKLAMGRFDIKITHTRYSFKEPYHGLILDETFYVSIMRGKREYLHELKFWNIHKIRKIFKEFEEPLIYK